MTKASRVVVQTAVDGSLRQLLSIEERGSGDLTIVLKRGLRGETVSGVDLGDVQQRKISVHRSPTSMSHNVVATEIIGGVRRRSYATIVPNKMYGSGVIWPVYCFRATHLPEDVYNPKTRSGDRVVLLGDLTSKQWSLLVMLIVRQPSIGLPKHWSFNHKAMAFSHFIVDILWTYLNVPTTPLGDHAFFGTKAQLIDNQVMTEIKDRSGVSPSPHRMLELQDGALRWLSEHAVRKIVRLARNSGREISPEDEERMIEMPFLLSGTMITI